MCTETKAYDANSEAVRKHVDIMQTVIQRMAANSSSCKTWCVTLVSAILVLVGDKGKPDYAPIAFIPVVLFLTLDTYYLALEKSFRASYNIFVRKLHDRGNVELSDLYRVTPVGALSTAIWDSVASFSIWPFYVLLVAAIFIAARVVTTTGK